MNVVKKLSQHHELYVLTSRPAEIREATVNWVNRYFDGYFKEVLQSGQVTRDGFNHANTKADICKKYGIDLHVDDAPIHVLSVIEGGTKVAVLEKPWNKNYLFDSPSIMKIKQITGLLELVEK